MSSEELISVCDDEIAVTTSAELSKHMTISKPSLKISPFIVVFWYATFSNNYRNEANKKMCLNFTCYQSLWLLFIDWLIDWLIVYDAIDIVIVIYSVHNFFSK